MSPSPRFVLLSLLAAAPLAAGCGSTTPSGPAGGPVTGAADEHCTVNGALETAKVGICLATGGGEDAAASDDAASGADGGGDDASATPTSDFGETLYNSMGYDDDCKYQVSFESTPIRKNASVTFTVTVAGLDPAGPAAGANLYAEVYLSPIHPAPNSGTTTTETAPGVYKVGPIVFDASGRWTVRFHMHEECSDEPADSPHGHVAFYIDVP